MNNMSTNEIVTSTEKRRRGRRPSAIVRTEVVAAAGELLFADGLASVTFDRVAAAAGASKTTIYKWWPTPGALAAEAYFARVEHDLEFHDVGDIGEELRRQLLAFVHLMMKTPAGRVSRELIGAAQTDTALREAFTAAYSHPRRDAAVLALTRARDRGELRPDAPLAVLVDQLWGGCYHRILVLDEPIDEDLVDLLVDNALRGARAHRPDAG
jgi:AcrR family transcriptional regulator